MQWSTDMVTDSEVTIAHKFTDWEVDNVGFPGLIEDLFAVLLEKQRGIWTQ